VCSSDLVCAISGTWSGAKGVATDEGTTCEVSFTPKGDELEVDAPFTDECRTYCGARATFTGTFLIPPKGCGFREVKKTRGAFKALFDKKQYAEAVALLTTLQTTCSRVLDRFEAMWIRNDLALAQHKAGDDAACLATLEPLAEYRDAPPDEPVGYEPTFSEEFGRIAKATRTNARLCGFKPAVDGGR
jgi:hypothetical protein